MTNRIVLKRCFVGWAANFPDHPAIGISKTIKGAVQALRDNYNESPYKFISTGKIKKINTEEENRNFKKLAEIIRKISSIGIKI